MRKWIYIRVVIVVLSFVTVLFSSPKSVNAPLLDWEALLASIFIIPIGLLFVIGIQRINPHSAPVWRYPSWSINPFTMKEPLQFFHFVGFVFLAGGVSHLVLVVASHTQLASDDLLGITIGASLLFGVKLSTVVFRGKMLRNDI
jgi:hypothetical protein